MKLNLEYTGNAKGYGLEMEMDINLKEDAEALGYITTILFHAAQTLANQCEKASPLLAPRISVGVRKAENERQTENNQIFPFTTFVVEDE